jgi:hypothetical protein
MQDRFSNLQLFIVRHGTGILLVDDSVLTSLIKLVCHDRTELVVQFDEDVDCEGGRYEKVFYEG